MQKIVPFLWFNSEAEEAMNYYAAVFPDSKVVSVMRGPDGKVLTGTFRLAGQEFMALNGGPQFKFTEAISLYVGVETQQEIDELWTKLTAGAGAPSRCGWLKDKYGLSWQIVPNALGRLLYSDDPARSKRVMDALLQMDKIDLKKLQDAYDGK